MCRNQRTRIFDWEESQKFRPDDIVTKVASFHNKIVSLTLETDEILISKLLKEFYQMLEKHF